jgi:hypothetical protein
MGKNLRPEYKTILFSFYELGLAVQTPIARLLDGMQNS